MDRKTSGSTAEQRLATLEKEVERRRQLVLGLESQLRNRMAISSAQARWALQHLFTALRVAFPSADTTTVMRSDEAFERVRCERVCAGSLYVWASSPTSPSCVRVLRRQKYAEAAACRAVNPTSGANRVAEAGSRRRTAGTDAVVSDAVFAAVRGAVRQV